MNRIKLDEVINYIESYTDESSYYIDKKIGEVIAIQNYYFNKAEEILDSGNESDFSGCHDWEVREIMMTLSILSDNEKRYVWLPEKSLILNDYEIMQDFCRHVSDPKISIYLLDAIRGKGAFGRFRSGVERFELTEDWYTHLNKAYRDTAIELCEKLGLSYD